MLIKMRTFTHSTCGDCVFVLLAHILIEARAVDIYIDVDGNITKSLKKISYLRMSVQK